MSLSVLLWAPVVLALIATRLPERWIGRVATVLSLIPLAIAIYFMVRFDPHTAALQFVTDKVWVGVLGIHYKLGLSGLNVALVLLTTVLFTASLAWSANRDVNRPRIYYFHFGVAETAVLGAFLAQDLIVFVGFFDLMLIPFYFLIGTWGTGNRVHATIKMVVYTAVGSFLMLVAAIAAGVLAAQQHGTALNFTYTAIQHLGISRGDQDWIFLGFAAAFLVKMPVTPFHGWVVEAYKSMPIPAVAVFSGVVAKVASYGFLAIALPLFPQASKHFQLLMLVIGLGSILWATPMAFTTRDMRGVITYSSVSQMGFILLGIFSLKASGGQGALLQMLNHGIVIAASFFVIAAAAARAGGDESLDATRGVAFRAPILATFFVIIMFANLAMPGSSNFIGEFMILLGTFTTRLWIAVCAFLGVIGASYYALRLFIEAMHHRKAAGVRSFEVRPVEWIALAPLTLIILVFAFYPQFGLEKSLVSLKASIASAAATGSAPARTPVNATPARSHVRLRASIDARRVSVTGQGAAAVGYHTISLSAKR